MSAIHPSARTLGLSSINPIKAGFLYGSIFNTGTDVITVTWISQSPDNDLNDDVLIIPPGAIFNFDFVAGRYYPEMTILCLDVAETAFFY